MRHRNWCLVALLLMVASGSGSAQKDGRKAPKRPKQITGTDTNNALAYYRYGLRMLDSDADEADAAFYWALRLQPSWPEALYAARTAILRSDPARLTRYLEGDERVANSREVRFADSLLYRAEALNPFLVRDLDRGLLTDYYIRLVEDDLRRRNPQSAAETSQSSIRFEIETYLMRSGNPRMQGWLAYSDRRFPEALKHYGEALKKKGSNATTHTDRASIFFLMGVYDSALVELASAIDEMQTKDKKEVVVFYRSKAVLHHRVGIVLLRKGDLLGAKVAFGHALEEDLAYYPAHLSLANLALATGDTSTARSEMELAVQIRGEDVTPHIQYGNLLLTLKQYEEAAAEFRKVVELEPYAADSYLALAYAEEAQVKIPEAISHYNGYLARTIFGDTKAAKIRAHVLELNGGKP